MKGKKLGAFLSRAIAAVGLGWKFFENDFTLYDSTHSRYSHALLLYIYGRLGLMANDWHFALFRKQQAGINQGRTRQGWKFREVSTMKSGAAGTCLGNTIANVIVHKHCLSQLNGGVDE